MLVKLKWIRSEEDNGDNEDEDLQTYSNLSTSSVLEAGNKKLDIGRGHSIDGLIAAGTVGLVVRHVDRR
jgi:hypothetical protein